MDVSSTIQFVLEIDNLKGFLRKVRPTWEERYENTAEHSWQRMALELTALQRICGLAP